MLSENIFFLILSKIYKFVVTTLRIVQNKSPIIWLDSLLVLKCKDYAKHEGISISISVSSKRMQALEGEILTFRIYGILLYHSQSSYLPRIRGNDKQSNVTTILHSPPAVFKGHYTEGGGVIHGTLSYVGNSMKYVSKCQSSDVRTVPLLHLQIPKSSRL